MNNKKLFKGTFNYAGETYEMFTHSVTIDLSFFNFITQISKKINYRVGYVRMYFNGNKDNYYIEEVKNA